MYDGNALHYDPCNIECYQYHWLALFFSVIQVAEWNYAGVPPLMMFICPPMQHTIIYLYPSLYRGCPLSRSKSANDSRRSYTSTAYT